MLDCGYFEDIYLEVIKKFPSFHLTSGENDDTQKKTEKRIEISKVMML